MLPSTPIYCKYVCIRVCYFCATELTTHSRSIVYFARTRTDAIRFALDRSTPEGCEPLVSAVVERTKVVLQDGGKGRDDYSVLVSVPVGCCLSCMHPAVRGKKAAF